MGGEKRKEEKGEEEVFNLLYLSVNMVEKKRKEKKKRKTDNGGGKKRREKCTTLGKPPTWFPSENLVEQKSLF